MTMLMIINSILMSASEFKENVALRLALINVVKVNVKVCTFLITHV